MDYLIPIVLLTLSAWSTAEPMAIMMERSRNTFPLYGGEFMEEYEPYAVAAFPIHAPMPILQVISPTAYAGKLRKQTKRPQPNRDLHAYASSYDPTYEQVLDQDYEHLFTDSMPQPKYKGSPYDDDASSVVVYARPNKNGGYSYRKPAAPTPAPYTQREPFIIRIHKYRVVH